MYDPSVSQDSQKNTKKELNNLEHLQHMCETLPMCLHYVPHEWPQILCSAEVAMKATYLSLEVNKWPGTVI